MAVDHSSIHSIRIDLRLNIAWNQLKCLYTVARSAWKSSRFSLKPHIGNCSPELIIWNKWDDLVWNVSQCLRSEMTRGKATTGKCCRVSECHVVPDDWKMHTESGLLHQSIDYFLIVDQLAALLFDQFKQDWQTLFDSKRRTTRIILLNGKFLALDRSMGFPRNKHSIATFMYDK